MLRGSRHPEREVRSRWRATRTRVPLDRLPPDRHLTLVPDGNTPPAPVDADALVPMLYGALRRLARRQLANERDGHTLSTTALVHEAYLRLAGPATFNSDNRAHFLAAAAVAMRRVLIDSARQYQAQKRGGAWRQIALSDVQIAADERADILVALDAALDALAKNNARLAQVVHCRFFGGMTEEETALALGVTDRTIRRDWIKARIWLGAALSGDIE